MMDVIQKMFRKVETTRKLYAANNTGALKLQLPRKYCELKGFKEGDTVQILIRKVNR